VQLFGAELEHLHQAGLVEHGVGVGRADQAGHATGHGGGHFGFEHAFVLVAGLAQARRQVHQAGQHDAAGRVDGAVGRKVGRHPVDTHDAARSQGHVAGLIETAGGVDHTAVLDQYLHDFKPNWPLALTG
jgi:predicted ArsR family transcriptional regulator